MATEQRYAVLGLAEHELRPELEQELVRTMRAEGEAPTVHAIATALRGSWARRRDGLHWPHRDGFKWPHPPSGFLSFVS